MEGKEGGVNAQKQRSFKKKKKSQAMEASTKDAFSNKVCLEKKVYFTPPLMVSKTEKSLSSKIVSSYKFLGCVASYH